MGNKSVLHISDVKETATIGSPFWNTNKKPKDFLYKIIFKKTFHWLKLGIFLFMMLMGLWGCFQSMFDPRIAQNSSIGIGLEYGFPFGQTGDYRFDLQMSADAHQYNTFINWSCSQNSGYGPFYGLFVWPASWIVNQIIYSTKNWWGGLNVLLSIFLLLLFIRLLTLSITLKSTFQSEKMSEIQGELAEINAKYKGLKDMQSRQLKQKEIMNLYNKNKIKPFAAFEQMFLTLPIFLVIYRVVTIVRPIKVTILFNIWNFSLTPLNQIFSSITKGGWKYIFFLLLVGGGQILSMWFPQKLTKKRSRSASTISAAGESQAKKNQKTQYIFMIVMCVIVAFSAVGVGVYWFLNSIFTLLQALLIHLILKNQKNKKSSSAKIINFEI